MNLRAIKFLCLSLGIAFLCTQCTIDMQTHISDGEKGWSKVSLDMESMSGMMEMMGKDAVGLPLDSLALMSDTLQVAAQEMNAAAQSTGVSNVQMDINEKEFFMRYEFEDFASIGRFSQKMAEKSGENPGLGMLSSPGEGSITRKGKKYFINFKVGDEMPGADEMQGMESFFTMNYTYSFDREIKSVKAPMAVEQTDHEVRFELNLKDLQDLANAGEQLEIRVK